MCLGLKRRGVALLLGLFLFTLGESIIFLLITENIPEKGAKNTIGMHEISCFHKGNFLKIITAILK